MKEIDPDNPPMTDEELASLRPAREVMPADLLARLTKRKPGQRGPGKKPAKVHLSLRLDREVFDKLGTDGAEVRERIHEILRKALKLRKPAA